MGNSILASLLRQRVGRSFEFGGFSVVRASSDSERNEAYELRFRVYVEQGWIEERDFPNGYLTDRFDRVSEQILVRDPSGEAIATTRFVRHSPLGFPTENLFSFTPPAVNRKALGEFGRLVITSKYRGGNRAPMLGMLKAVFECMVEDKTTHVFAFLSPGLANSYSALGCVSVPLSTLDLTNENLWNRRMMKGYFATQEAIPVLFSLEEMLREIGVFSSQEREEESLPQVIWSR